MMGKEKMDDLVIVSLLDDEVAEHNDDSIEGSAVEISCDNEGNEEAEEVSNETTEKESFKGKAGHFCKDLILDFCVILALLFVILGLSTYAGSMRSYGYLSQLNQNIANKCTNEILSSEDDGIVMSVDQIYVAGNRANVYISMTDTQKSRIDDTIDLFDSFQIHTNCDKFEGVSLVDYDDTKKKATFLLTVSNESKKISGSQLSFEVSEFLSHVNDTTINFDGFDLTLVENATETQYENDLTINGSSGNYVSNPNARYLYPEATQCEKLVDGAIITAYGFVDGKLHMQVYYEDVLSTNNHGYMFVVNGDEVVDQHSISFWDAEHKGLFYEYIFDLDDTMDLSQCKVYGHFTTCQDLTEGEWKISCTLENKEFAGRY